VRKSCVDQSGVLYGFWLRRKARKPVSKRLKREAGATSRSSCSSRCASASSSCVKTANVQRHMSAGAQQSRHRSGWEGRRIKESQKNLDFWLNMESLGLQFSPLPQAWFFMTNLVYRGVPYTEGAKDAPQSDSALTPDANYDVAATAKGAPPSESVLTYRGGTYTKKPMQDTRSTPSAHRKTYRGVQY
jgi:hypothetical protein